MRGFRAFIMNGLRWEIPSVGYFKYCMHVAVDHIYLFHTAHTQEFRGFSETGI